MSFPFTSPKTSCSHNRSADNWLEWVRMGDGRVDVSLIPCQVIICCDVDDDNDENEDDDDE